MAVTFKRGEPLMINYTPGSAVAGGVVVVINGVPLITHNPIEAAALGALGYPSGNGTYIFPKVTGAISALAAVYWDVDGDPLGGTAGTGALTTTSSGNIAVGFLGTLAAAETDTTAEVVFCQTSTVPTSSAEANVIADPGASGAIPITSSGRVAIVTAGAETRTLAAPTFIGQTILIYMKTDGGDCVVTCATTVNETGNNTITFDNTGESFFARAVEEGANLRWRLAVVDGAALTTV